MVNFCFKKEDGNLIDNLEEYIKRFSRLICDIDEKDKESTKSEIENYFMNYPVIETGDYGYLGRVWILIGKINDDKPYVSLMVAQSENIKKEIDSDVDSMYNTEYKKKRYEYKKNNNDWNFEMEVKYNLDIIKSPQIAKINSNNSIYLYQVRHEKIKNQYLYRYIKKKYTNLKIYEVNIDQYLDVSPEMDMGVAVKNIYEFAKDYYVESKLAVETNALFWNYYKSGVGKRVYYYFKGNNNSLN